MGDPKNPRRTQFSLPPGCRFYPSEEQVLCYYITNKNNRTNDDDGDGDDDCPYGFNVIKLIDLYNYDPFDLPEIACFSYGYKGRRRHWYCYTARVVNERARRKTGSGYWKRRGRVRDVVGRGGHVVLGRRTSFVFYLGNSPKSAVRTDWVMYEYTLVDHLKAFVLCRIFVKSRCVNNISDHVLSSYAEESVSAVRHVGVQYNETDTSDIAGAKTCDDSSIGRENEILRFPMGVGQAVDDRIGTLPVSVTSSQFPSDIHPNELVRSPRLNCGSALFIDPVSTEHLVSILEDDYIELDDLICPLLGSDNIG